MKLPTFFQTKQKFFILLPAHGMALSVLLGYKGDLQEEAKMECLGPSRE